MKNYIVYFTDVNTGACSPVDTITAPDSYTPQDYIKDCASNGICWGEGEITFSEYDE